ncbi:methyltransferase domain-containing protein [Pseudomonas sp. 91RF]|jgi:ubiquinone/menaquinone biosynthesis C-methylase UbiE|uniref:class I SAM-dependent methyltransferase n=1 Tax=Pseudomonas TaxID=286 RepID=UPI000BD13926|nr:MULTISPECIES: class I SAM-dependent methyltransferase [Pseudomonas]PCR98233.1 methyltransferase [Pseudomonas fluorescens]MCX2543612.1 class I SAM-dependent methyltransferase [Pseudomonas sp. COW5]PMX04210.1 methyltransferase domain-containing protein [Pseudomonas sp. FW215-R2]PMX10118.1 methyltransferase domain-containing protein [Pseudomonas sp. FW215-L1]PMX26242.1 methyltransferase domain-containing protein [Pseudomonas sp. FW215-E1]
MKTEWDYTTLADAYLKRPDYADAAIDAMLSIAGAEQGDKFCDVGAGVAHLTLMLAARGLDVTAVEPNDAMRANGIKRTAELANVKWHEGTGEVTGQATQAFDMVTFGSSFNVCDRQQALKETARILKPRGWFACMWNHRNLEDPIQARIEAIIKERVPGYGYGTRREDQTAVIDASELFGPVVHLDARVIHEQSIEECLEAWRSHATLERQAGANFHEVISAIDDYLKGLKTPSIQIPYSTNIWVAQLR